MQRFPVCDETVDFQRGLRLAARFDNPRVCTALDLVRAKGIANVEDAAAFLGRLSCLRDSIVDVLVTERRFLPVVHYP